MDKKRILLVGLTLVFSSVESSADPFQAARENLLAQIQSDMRQMAPIGGLMRFSSRTIGAMRDTPRHLFVPKQLIAYSYRNRPLPIGYGQTISQPYIVALMTDLIEPHSEHKTLEIGTGSAYQAAVLSHLVEHVFTMEIVPELAGAAASRLNKLKYSNVTVRHGDGYFGWKEEAPFDSIIVTAAANHVPPALIRQLKPGGKMIIPVGASFLAQQLTLVEKDKAGKVTTRQVLPVRFVPFTRSD